MRSRKREMTYEITEVRQRPITAQQVAVPVVLPSTPHVVIDVREHPLCKRQKTNQRKVVLR